MGTIVAAWAVISHFAKAESPNNQKRKHTQKKRQRYCLIILFCIFPIWSACLWSVSYSSWFTDMHKAQNCSFQIVFIDFSIVTSVLKTGNPKKNEYWICINNYFIIFYILFHDWSLFWKEIESLFWGCHSYY